MTPGCIDEPGARCAAIAAGERQKGGAELRRRVAACPGNDAKCEREVRPWFSRALEQRPRIRQSSLEQRKPPCRISGVRVGTRGAECLPCATEITGAHPGASQCTREAHPLARREVAVVGSHQRFGIGGASERGERFDVQWYVVAGSACRIPIEFAEW